MRVMVLVKATASSEAGEMPSAELLSAMGAYNEALVAAGILSGGGEGLKPSSAAKRVVFDGDARHVMEGPFPTEEVVAGYWIWTVKDMDEAVAWAKRCPNPMPTRSEIEIRPVYELSDFENAPADVVAFETRMRAGSR